MRPRSGGTRHSDERGGGRVYTDGFAHCSFFRLHFWTPVMSPPATIYFYDSIFGPQLWTPILYFLLINFETCTCIQAIRRSGDQGKRVAPGNSGPAPQAGAWGNRGRSRWASWVTPLGVDTYLALLALATPPLLAGTDERLRSFMRQLPRRLQAAFPATGRTRRAPSPGPRDSTSADDTPHPHPPETPAGYLA